LHFDFIPKLDFLQRERERLRAGKSGQGEFKVFNSWILKYTRNIKVKVFVVERRLRILFIEGAERLNDK